MALVAALLGIAFAFSAPWLASTLALVGMASLAMYVKELVDGRVDPYSITALRRLEEREELRQLLDNEPGIAEGAEVVCPSCLEPYAARLGTCPNCRISCD